MVDKWVISDTHFGHANIIKFTDKNGIPIRPGFDDAMGNFVSFAGGDISFHDEMLIKNWNERVKPQDKVYHLGDWGMPLSIARRLNGHIRLILGNHDDIHDAHDVANTFEKVLSWKLFTKEFALPVAMCHYPLHRYVDDPVPRRVTVHGHIHEKVIRNAVGKADPWYVNVCVEHTNCAPLSFDELSDKIKKRATEIKQCAL